MDINVGEPTGQAWCYDSLLSLAKACHTARCVSQLDGNHCLPMKGGSGYGDKGKILTGEDQRPFY